MSNTTNNQIEKNSSVLKYWYVFVVFVVFVVFPKKVLAQELSLGVYPPILQINATPPTAIKQSLTVSNQSDTPVHLAISMKPFTQSDSNNGQVTYLSPDEVFGADPHIFEKIQLLDGDTPVDSLDLSPKEVKNLILHIGLPKDEPAGDYYFSILFSSNTSGTSANDGSQFAGGIATNVLLSIGPYDTTTGAIDDFSSPLIVSHGPIPFSVLVNNLSRHFISPTGEILIKDMYGKLVGQVNLVPVNILEGTSRYMPSDNSQSSIVNSQLNTAIWNQKVVFGPYKATLILSLSPTGPLFTRSIYFLAFPWQFLLGFCLAIIIITIIILRIRQRIQY